MNLNELKLRIFLFVIFVCSLLSACNDKTSPESKILSDEEYLESIMSASPLLPDNISNKSISCPISNSEKLATHLASSLVDYTKGNWEERISKNWQFFSSPPEQGKILIIDFKRQLDELSYQYFSNNTQYDLFEPWSASKVMAITAAMAKANLQADGLDIVGRVPIADLITSIHSYTEFGGSKASSNSIAAYFANLSGREILTNYFHDGWLKLNNKEIRFRGSYGEAAYQPEPNLWFKKGEDNGVVLPGYQESTDDPFSQSYRCNECGLTGNKPMTTLAMAEWLKRLASHQRDSLTQFPNINEQDLLRLFYGVGHSQPKAKVGGMMLGISQLVTLALTEAMSGELVAKPKEYLDKATSGEWRVWQKIGWGPSETRGAGEYVVLAHICLPIYQGGKEFTVSAQVAIPGATEGDEVAVGRKMQSLLKNSFKQYLSL